MCDAKKGCDGEREGCPNNGCTNCYEEHKTSKIPIIDLTSLMRAHSLEVSEIRHLCWQMVNELRDANKTYFVDQIPEEMVKVYDLCDKIEMWLIDHRG